MREAVDLFLRKIEEEEAKKNAEVERLEAKISDIQKETFAKLNVYRAAIKEICHHEHGTYDSEEFYSGSYDSYTVQKCKACHKVLSEGGSRG